MRRAFAAPALNASGNCRHLRDEIAEERVHVLAMREACALSGPHGEKFALSGLLGRNGEITDERPLKRIGKDLRPFPVQFIEQLILDTPCESSGEASGLSGRTRLAGEKSIVLVRAGTRLFTCKENGSTYAPKGAGGVGKSIPSSFNRCSAPTDCESPALTICLCVHRRRRAAPLL